MSLVGIPEGGGYFQALAAALGQLKDGQEYDGDPRGKFIFHVSENPFAAAGPNFTVTWFQQVAG
jgi:hypothetical protein